jgi:hypothetical protein
MAELPVQYAAFWHGPPAATHIVVDGRNVCAGQVVDVPSQYEALAQTVAAAHTVPCASGVVAGHVGELPVQKEPAEQPVAGVHCVVAGR